MRLHKLNREAARMGIAAAAPSCVIALVIASDALLDSSPRTYLKERIDWADVRSVCVLMVPAGMLAYAVPRLLVRRPKS